jgi:hypothetical protein
MSLTELEVKYVKSLEDRVEELSTRLSVSEKREAKLTINGEDILKKYIAFQLHNAHEFARGGMNNSNNISSCVVKAKYRARVIKKIMENEQPIEANFYKMVEDAFLEVFKNQ